MGAIIAGTTLAVYLLTPDSLRNASLTVVIGGFGALALLYYVSLHQLLKKNHLKFSSIMVSLITATTVMLIIIATGGLDSPYYAMWLLGIVVAGFFGAGATLIVVLVTSAYVAYEAWVAPGASSSYFISHLGVIVLSYGTGGVSEWIHRTLGRADHHETVARLSGKLSEESLKSEAIMQSVGEGVLVMNTARQIQLFNPAAAKLTGWDLQSATGIDYRLVLNLRDSAGSKLTDISDPITKVWQSGKNLVSTELTMETKAGRKIAVEISLSPIISNNSITGAIGLFRDISAEKAVERQRNEFISTASHEMRTPVAAVEGYLSLAMNSAVATVDDRAKGYLVKAHAATQHLGELFRDLLSVTKLEDGRATTVEYFDAGKLIADAVDDMRFEAEKKGLDLQFGPADQKVRRDHNVIPVYAVKANPQRIREVTMNLLENAIKFTASGSVRVGIGGTSDSVTISVADSGIGIAEEDIQHLFQKFYRIDSTATRTIGGTGLGLYLCRSIIEHSGGRIWVESHIGEGSSFNFTLPRQPSEKLVKKPAIIGSLAGPESSTDPSQRITKPVVHSPQAALATAPMPPPPVSAPIDASDRTVTDIKKPVAAR